MQAGATDRALRVVIVDDHAISRSVFAALLRSEGVDVVAELMLGDATTATLRGLAPDMVVVDARPGIGDGPEVGRRAASFGCAVVLTSSARPSSFGPALDGFDFIAKADICRAALADLIRPSGRIPPANS
jgi:DNA-binding NarL/FixJ family response regulator